MVNLPDNAVSRVIGKGPVPTDAMPFGVHSALAASSQHKKLVSAALHLKKESVGHKSNPTAYKINKLAFAPKKGKMYG